MSWSRTLRRSLTTLLVAVLVLIALSMSALRLAVAYAPQLRGEVERVLTLALERPLTLGGIRASWAGLHPRLVLEDVRLAGEGSLANLEVPELEVDVDLLATLKMMRLQLAQVAVSELSVQARYNADGSLQVVRVGNALIQEDSLDEEGPRELPALLQLKRTAVELTDSVSGTTYHLAGVDLEFSASGGEYALAGYVPLPASLGRSVRFRAEWRGGDGSDELAGRLYVDARRLRLDTLSPLLARLAPMPVLQGAMDTELWAELTGQSLVQLGGHVALSDAGLDDEAGEQAAAISQAKGRFQWYRQASGWRLTVADLMFASASRAWPATHLTLGFDERHGRQSLAFSGNYLNLGDLAPLVARLPFLSAEHSGQLAQTRPVAELFDPRLTLRWHGADLEAFDGYARFRDAGMHALQSLPGASGLSGEVWASETGGYLQLGSRQGTLDFAQLFRQRLPFDTLQGEVFWRVDDESWVIEAPQLSAVNEDGRAQARLRVGKDGQEPLFIDLRANVSEGVSRNSVPRYLPVSVMPDSVVRWLDSAEIDGDVSQADVLMYGHVRDFPFTDLDGVFHVQADFSGASLDYQAGWPKVEAAAGRLYFINDGMRIDLSEGRVHGAAITQAQARIERLGTTSLTIDGQVRGSGAQYLGFVRDSPLGKGIREQLSEMQLSGNHDLDLHLDIPFDDGELRVRGDVALEQAAYRVPKWDFLLDQLQGRVSFTERGVQASGVKGRYRDIPVQLAATTEGDGEQGRIQVAGQLHAAPAALLGETSLPMMQGQTDWGVRLILPAFQAELAQDAPTVELHVDSRLEGVAVDLPRPLGKAEPEERSLRLSLPIHESGGNVARLAYGDEIKALLGLAPEGLEIQRLGVQLGPGEPQLPRRGAVVRGRLKELDLEGWSLPKGGTGTVAVAGLEPLLADVELAQVRIAGQQFENTEIRLRPASDGWSLDLSGPDIAGTVALSTLPAQPIAARLERLRLQLPEMDAVVAERRPKASDRDSLPAVDIEVVELIVRDQSLGRLELVTRETLAGLTLEQASLIGPLLELKATGGWDRERSRSRLALTMDSHDTGRFLDALGYRDAMRGGALQGNLSVEWGGHLTDFSLPELAGSLDMTVRDGQILKVEPGAGRLFGLLSIGELPRRLSLDFSDLFGKGFAFDTIKARLQLADGNVFTRDFHMDGPSARVELDGRIGLVARDYDQYVTVTPNVSTALPAIGAVAAGPVGAVAGFVTQKLLQKGINRLSRYRYQVAGSWDAPQIEPVTPPNSDVSAEGSVSAPSEPTLP